MTAFVMICEGRADDGSGPVGQYLKSFDPEAFDGMGATSWTNDLDHAKRFDSVLALLAEWQRVPANHPIRLTDGRPNRPLTAYSVSTMSVD